MVVPAGGGQGYKASSTLILFALQLSSRDLNDLILLIIATFTRYRDSFSMIGDSILPVN